MGDTETSENVIFRRRVLSPFIIVVGKMRGGKPQRGKKIEYPTRGGQIVNHTSEFKH